MDMSRFTSSPWNPPSTRVNVWCPAARCPKFPILLPLRGTRKPESVQPTRRAATAGGAEVLNQQLPLDTNDPRHSFPFLDLINPETWQILPHVQRPRPCEALPNATNYGCISFFSTSLFNSDLS